MTTEPPITDPLLLSVLEAATQARTQSLLILDLIDTYNTSSTPPPPTSTTTSSALLDLSKHQKALTALLTRTRRLDHSAILAARATKAETALARQEVDSLHLELQNLYYEQRHLRGEIAACEDFVHSYLEIEMVSLEEFLVGRGDLVGGGEAEVTEARIRDEYARRVELEEKRLGLLRRKEELVRETGGKREELANLDRELERWVAGQEGVRKMFEGREKKVALVGGEGEVEVKAG